MECLGCSTGHGPSTEEDGPPSQLLLSLTAADMPHKMSKASYAMWATGGRFVSTLTAHIRLVGHTLALATVIASAPAAAQPCPSDVNPEQELRAHHIGIKMGLLNPSTDVVRLGDPNLAVEGNTFMWVFNYRYSLSAFVDLSGDIRSWGGPWTTPDSQHFRLGVYSMGPGVRLYGLKRTMDRRIMPYLQGNIYFVQEELTVSERRIDNGIGFGLSGGVDLRVSRLVSIPIEATYVGTSGDDAADLSGFGLSVGVSFSF